MAMSGIEVDPEVTAIYNETKMKKTHKHVLFKIENKKKIVLDEMADPVKTETKEEDKEYFQKLLDTLKDEPRYILYDFSFTNKEGRFIQKLAFIFWCSDKSKIGDKMVYASSKDTIKKVFSGIGAEFQANDRGDMDYDTLVAEVEKKA